jgi:CBS domain containing-hemolysin-like protein
MLVNVAYAGNSALLTVAIGQVPRATGLDMAVVTLTTLLGLILIGEVTPKMLAFRLGERWAVVGAAPVALFARAMAPVLWVTEKVFVTPLTRIIAPRPSGAIDMTADELATMLDVSARRGVLDDDAGSMLQGIIELTDLSVGDIMVPRVDMVACDVNDPPEALDETFRRTGLRKIPVYDGDIDNIVGVVHAKRLFLRPGTPVRQLVRDVIFVPEAADLEKLLLQFRVKRRQMAMVVDEYGGLAGLVTLEDALEEIVGDIPDTEGERSPKPVQRIGTDAWLVDGMLSIHEWVDAFHMDIAIERYRTIGGFVASLLGRMPRVGDRTSYHNLRFEVVSMRGRRIGRLRIELTREGRA